VTDRSALRWLPGYLYLAAIWGCSFLFIKIAVGQLHPAYVTLARVAIGALTLLVVLAVTGKRLPRDPRLWCHLFVVAVFMNAVPFTLFGFGEQRVSSALAGIWNATTPLVTLVAMLVVFPQERPTRSRVVGLLVGFLGVLTVLGVWRGVGGAALTGQLLCFAAAASYGLGLPYIRRFVAGRPEPGSSVAAGQLLMATFQLAVLAPLLAGAPTRVTSLRPSVIVAVLALGALGTGIAFVASYQVIRLAGASTAASVTYLMPVFATIAGALVLNEQITWYQPVGAAVILVGVAVSQGLWSSLRRRSSPPPEGSLVTTRDPVPTPVAAPPARS
jgi:drug/metabolite transporter (DMT)-like permease